MAAWGNWSSKILEKIYQRWELVLSLILLDNGGNKYVESYRGKLTSNPKIVENDEMSNDALIASIKSKIKRDAESINVETKVVVQKDKPDETKDNLMNVTDILLVIPTKVTSSRGILTKKKREES